MNLASALSIPIFSQSVEQHAGSSQKNSWVNRCTHMLPRGTPALSSFMPVRVGIFTLMAAAGGGFAAAATKKPHWPGRISRSTLDWSSDVQWRAKQCPFSVSTAIKYSAKKNCFKIQFPIPLIMARKNEWQLACLPIWFADEHVVFSVWSGLRAGVMPRHGRTLGAVRVVGRGRDRAILWLWPHLSMSSVVFSFFSFGAWVFLFAIPVLSSSKHLLRWAATSIVYQRRFFVSVN